MKSFVFEVDMLDTLGALELAVQEETAVFGILALGSNGETVFAPVTANSSPDAEVGVPLSVMVITSEEIVVDAIPYHSV